jgi:aminotransferase in exopolysaccharide biosynthesis
MSVEAERIIDAVRTVLGDGDYPLHEPNLSEIDHTTIQDCLKSGFVSSVGQYVDTFESELAKYTGAKHAVAVVNGTAALHLALLCAGVKPTHEVITPSLTFIGTANAIAHAGATPHFVDVEESTFGIDPARLRVYLAENTVVTPNGLINKHSGNRISALVPVHIFGHPCQIDALRDIADEFDLALIEDAAEALGSFYKGQHAGTFGLAGILSFNGNKIITTGGGGALLTDDDEFAALAKHLSTTAKVPGSIQSDHDAIGYNYRLPNINAALGCSQLTKLSGYLASKQRLASRYKEAFATSGVARFIDSPDLCTSNFWLQTIRLNNSEPDKLHTIVGDMNDVGLGARPIWKPLHTTTPYLDCPRDALPITELLAKQLINLPSSAGLV